MTPNGIAHSIVAGHNLPDIQSIADSRQIAITRVGVKKVRHPVRIAVDSDVMPSVAEFDMMVYLPQEKKGTHMSRFIEVLDGQHESAISIAGLNQLLVEMLDRLGSEMGTIRMRFPLFLRKAAPVSGVQSLLDYDVEYIADSRPNGVTTAIKVVVPVMSLCPCSKEISEYGAHNQRSHITIDAMVRPESSLSVADLIGIAERSASCEIWGLLKRPDEKFVTERSYENPKFVEDILRDAARELAENADVLSYKLEVENFESIHNHSAYGYIEG